MITAEPTYVIVDARTTAPLALGNGWVTTHISKAVSGSEYVLCVRNRTKRTCHRTRA